MHCQFRSWVVEGQLAVLEGLQKALRASSSLERRCHLEQDSRDCECRVFQCHAAWDKYTKEEDSRPPSYASFPFNVKEAVV